MGQSPEDLRRDIEETRDSLSENLDAIGDRVSPGRVIERRRNRMRGSVDSLRDRVMGPASGPSGQGSVDDDGGVTSTLRSAPESARQQAQGNPLLAGAVAFGVGVAAAALFKGSQPEARAVQTLKEAAQPLKEPLAAAAQQVASTVQEGGQQAAEQLKESATQSAEQVKGTAQSSAQQTKDAGAHAVEEVKAKSPTSGDSG